MLHSILAIEICAPLLANSLLRRALHSVVNGPPAMGLYDKKRQYGGAAEILIQNLGVIEKGCWDYFDNDERAKKDFDMWSKGMTTEEGARTEPSGMPDPYRGGPRYLTFTMAFLIEQNSHTDSMLAAVCNIRDDRLWYRDTFARVLRGVQEMSFASVESDVIYLIPRDDDWGLTVEDLRQPKFHYLRQLQ